MRSHQERRTQSNAEGPYEIDNPPSAKSARKISISRTLQAAMVVVQLPLQ